MQTLKLITLTLISTLITLPLVAFVIHLTALITMAKR